MATNPPPWAAASVPEEAPQGAIAPSAPTAPTPPVETPPAPVSQAPAPVEDEAPARLTVTVTVPRAFQLRTDDNNVHLIKAGVQEMDPAMAMHWYSKANGVTVYQPK